MNYSKHNIFSKIRDSENYFIVNPLTGNADILDADDAEKLEILRDGGEVKDDVFIAELTEKGYLADETAETRLYRSRYLNFIDERDKDEIQIFFVTNYSCNFTCSYCYQDQYNNPGKELNPEIIDSFFSKFEHFVHLVTVKRFAFGCALNFDKFSCAGADDVHINFGV